MMEHLADAEAGGGGGTGDDHRLAAPADLARRRLERAVENLDQCRLAGAVLAEEGMDLTRLEGEIDMVVGAERAEILGDADGGKGRLAPRAPRLPAPLGFSPCFLSTSLAARKPGGKMARPDAALLRDTSDCGGRIQHASFV